MSLKTKKQKRRATVAVQVAIMLPVLFGFAALSVDVGVMYNARAEIQSTADAAARGAAALLNEYGTVEEPTYAPDVARAEALEVVAANKVLGQSLTLDQDDVTFGKATYDSGANTYDFTPDNVFPNAVRVNIHANLPLYFGGIFGKSSTEVVASATALLVPRDIVIVADISGSTSFDSQLRHYDIPEIEVNLFDVWAALPLAKGNAGVGNGLDPPPPGNPHSENDQPGTGPGSPGNQGGNPNPGAEPFDGSGAHGPRWGWMTGYGAELYPTADYTTTDDVGLYYIPKNANTTDADVIENLTAAGYTADERAALLSSADDGNATYYRNRVKVMLGLAGWRSKKADSKFHGGPGNGNNRVESNELWQNVDYQFDAGSWSGYLNYVRSSSSPMNTDQANFRYQYGLKTFIDYVLVQNAGASETPELADAPSQPFHAIKEAVDQMVTRVSDFEAPDQMSLVSYATQALLEEPLALVYDPETGAHNTAVATRINELQPAHYYTGTAYTNIDHGLEVAIQELTSERARWDARKVILLLTDGQANRWTDEFGHVQSNNNASKEAAKSTAQDAVDQAIQIYTISVGGDADTTLMADIAEIGGGDWMHAGGSIEEYAAALDQIFKQLSGGSRPVELID